MPIGVRSKLQGHKEVRGSGLAIIHLIDSKKSNWCLDLKLDRRFY
jgi:hypothetical protein